MKRNVLTLSVVSIAAVLLVTSLTGCLKNNNDSTQPGAAVSVLQASPSDAKMDLYFNTEKINTNGPMTYPSAGYKSVKAGNYMFSLVNSATGDTIVQRTDSLESSYYSLIVYDTGAATSMMLFPDQFQSASTSGTFIRYLQLSPDAGPVNFRIDTLLASDYRTFADNVTDPSRAIFDGIDQGVYSFTALNANTGDTLATLPSVTISPQQGASAYTLILRGLASHQDSLGLKLTLQANY